jgi:hypothetical protein
MVFVESGLQCSRECSENVGRVPRKVSNGNGMPLFLRGYPSSHDQIGDDKKESVQACAYADPIVES